MIYLIGGTGRTGKSTLAHKILENKKISTISTDVLINLMMDHVRPQDNSDSRLYIVKKAENFFPHLKKMINANKVLGIKNFVYEGDIILPEQVATLSKEYEVKACFLGFSAINVEKLKKYTGNHQWVNELSTDELNNLPKRIVDDSNYIKAECQKYGFEYFDLSINYKKEHQRAYLYMIS